jgi:hypothetical protein
LFPQKAVEVLLANDTDKWKKLSEVKNVRNVEQLTIGRILVHLDSGVDADEVVNNMLKLIVQLGIRVRGISLLSPSLDEVYYNYVQEAEN